MRHLHLRKRATRNLEPYPSRHFWKRILDTLVYGAGVLGPLFTIPQVYQIYSTQSAGDIAPLSWLVWALFDLPWILYGFVHKEFPIVVTYTLWFIFNGLVFVGALLYGN
jgi:uncharacterized protein with PQ loop repeat